MTKTLVKGYLIDGVIDGAETLYAVAPSGLTYKAGPHPSDNRFDRPTRTWERITVKPCNAEFIGNYRVCLPQ